MRVGVYGAELIPTPNLDRLAAEGIRFTDAYCTAATCTPSRYWLLTGDYAFCNPRATILRGDSLALIKPGTDPRVDPSGGRLPEVRGREVASRAWRGKGRA